jgi:hypothetical protein
MMEGLCKLAMTREIFGELARKKSNCPTSLKDRRAGAKWERPFPLSADLL